VSFSSRIIAWGLRGRKFTKESPTELGGAGCLIQQNKNDSSPKKKCILKPDQGRIDWSRIGIVGDMGVGKTALMRLLCGESNSHSKNEVSSLSSLWKVVHCNIFVIAFDLLGFFLNPESPEIEGQENATKQLEIWINGIAQHAPNSSIVLVGKHSDEIPDRKNCNAINDRISSMLLILPTSVQDKIDLHDHKGEYEFSMINCCVQSSQNEASIEAGQLRTILAELSKEVPESTASSITLRNTLRSSESVGSNWSTQDESLKSLSSEEERIVDKHRPPCSFGAKFPPPKGPLLTANQVGWPLAPRSNVQTTARIHSSPYRQKKERTPEILEISSDLIQVGAMIHKASSFSSLFMAFKSGAQLVVKRIWFHDSGVAKRHEIEGEIMILQHVQHKFVIGFLGHNLSEKDQIADLYLEFASSGSLREVYQENGPMQDVLVRKFAMQILQGLEYIHQLLVIHRNLKASNILLTHEGICKISSFGNSNACNESADRSLVGSVPWMAPEIIMGKVCSFGVDIWAFGATILEISSGKRPWSALSSHLDLMLHISRTTCGPPVPSDFSRELRDFIVSCFQIDSSVRPNCNRLQNHRFLCPQPPFG